MRTHDHLRPDTSPRCLPRERKTGPSATSYHPLPLFPVFSSLHRTLGREKRGSLALYQKWEGRFQETHPEVGGDCKNVRLAWDFLAGRPLRQTCLLAPVLIWIGKGRTGEAGREEGLPLERLHISCLVWQGYGSSSGWTLRMVVALEPSCETVCP